MTCMRITTIDPAACLITLAMQHLLEYAMQYLLLQQICLPTLQLV